ncbi:MAG TPA: PQQ-like beta-propeller repeat protein [Pirellulaceae bacterium]|nr:PQQ-like beta-propeller repeat protein [Pirellulaceae bacterium]HMO93480.1 PQQ-like beta-propeller repeat protein [Pirellulaceae bacterium]HMP69205.1 PQQ-like beta-propeller repeat protein [Pirellulaceae bacterium]
MTSIRCFAPKFSLILFCLAVFSASIGFSQTSSDHWPQWRGPDRTGVAKLSPIVDRWPEGGPNQLWVSREGGLGYSGFSFAHGGLFTMGQENDRQFVLRLDAATGRKVWQTEIGSGYENNWGGGPRSTPTIDGGVLYALDANGILVCLNVSDGKQIWKVDLKEFGGTIPKWGYSESVLVDGDQVVCTPGGPRGAVLALNKNDGRMLWQLDENKEEAHYSSIVKANIQGVDQYVQLMEKAVLGISPDGKLLWSTDWPGTIAVIPTPIVHENRVYVTSGYGIGSKQIEISSGNEVEFKWYNKVMKNHHGGAIFLDSYVYGYSDSVGWICQDWESGEIEWRERSALGKGAIGYADGKFICLSEDSGEVVMISASSQNWNELGRFTLNPQTERRKPAGKIWVHPVVFDGKLYLRDQELIYCYDVAK